MRSLIAARITLFAFIFMLSACGYKTPLQLPKPKPDAKAAATEPAESVKP